MVLWPEHAKSHLPVTGRKGKRGRLSRERERERKKVRKERGKSSPAYFREYGRFSKSMWIGGLSIVNLPGRSQASDLPVACTKHNNKASGFRLYLKP